MIMTIATALVMIGALVVFAANLGREVRRTCRAPGSGGNAKPSPASSASSCRGLGGASPLANAAAATARGVASATSAGAAGGTPLPVHTTRAAALRIAIGVAGRRTSALLGRRGTPGATAAAAAAGAGMLVNPMFNAAAATGVGGVGWKPNPVRRKSVVEQEQSTQACRVFVQMLCSSHKCGQLCRRCCLGDVTCEWPRRGVAPVNFVGAVLCRVICIYWVILCYMGCFVCAGTPCVRNSFCFRSLCLLREARVKWRLCCTVCGSWAVSIGGSDAAQSHAAPEQTANKNRKQQELYL